MLVTHWTIFMIKVVFLLQHFSFVEKQLIFLPWGTLLKTFFICFSKINLLQKLCQICFCNFWYLQRPFELEKAPKSCLYGTPSKRTNVEFVKYYFVWCFTFQTSFTSSQTFPECYPIVWFGGNYKMHIFNNFLFKS